MKKRVSDTDLMQRWKRNYERKHESMKRIVVASLITSGVAAVIGFLFWLFVTYTLTFAIVFAAIIGVLFIVAVWNSIYKNL